jgi:hypothetical protein
MTLLKHSIIYYQRLHSFWLATMFLAELQAACCRLHGCDCFIPAPAAVVQLSHTFGLLFHVLLL